MGGRTTSVMARSYHDDIARTITLNAGTSSKSSQLRIIPSIGAPRHVGQLRSREAAVATGNLVTCLGLIWIKYWKTSRDHVGPRFISKASYSYGLFTPFGAATKQVYEFIAVSQSFALDQRFISVESDLQLRPAHCLKDGSVQMVASTAL